jgi:hypothetical protein
MWFRRDGVEIYFAYTFLDISSALFDITKRNSCYADMLQFTRDYLFLSFVTVIITEGRNKKQTERLLVRKRTIPANLPRLVGDVSANFYG